MFGRFSRLLVVDGCHESRQVTHRILHRLGYENIEYAPDGRTALRMLLQTYYRLVIADWDAAQVTGLEILQAMRTDKRMSRTPFVMAIPRWQKKFVEVARDDGVTFYASKPLTSEVLAERLAQFEGTAAIVPKDVRREPVLTGPEMATPATPSQFSRRAL